METSKERTHAFVTDGAWMPQIGRISIPKRVCMIPIPTPAGVRVRDPLNKSVKVTIYIYIKCKTIDNINIYIYKTISTSMLDPILVDLGPFGATTLVVYRFYVGQRNTICGQLFDPNVDHKFIKN